MIRLAFAMALCCVIFAAALGYAQDGAERASAPAAQALVEESKPLESSSAQTKSPDSTESRYTFSHVQDGYVRLDNRTGQVSFCSKRTVGWACPEDRGVLENEIARLQEENATLRKDLLTRGLSLPGTVKPDSPVAGGDRSFTLPNDPNLDRMRAVIEKAWRRLVDLVVNIQKDMSKKS